MRERRCAMGVGVIDDVLYAVGGHNGLISLKSVEAYRPSTGVWTTIPEMHYPRCNAGITTHLIILNYFMAHIFLNLFNLSLTFKYRSSCIRRYIVCYWWI